MCLAIMILKKLPVFESSIGTVYLIVNLFYHLLSALITFFTIHLYIEAAVKSGAALCHTLCTALCPTEPGRQTLAKEKENCRQENLTLSALMKFYMYNYFSLQTCIFDSHHLINSHFPLTIKCYGKCTEKSISSCL